MRQEPISPKQILKATPLLRRWTIPSSAALTVRANTAPLRTQMLAGDILALWTLVLSVSSTALESECEAPIGRTAAPIRPRTARRRLNQRECGRQIANLYGRSIGAAFPHRLLPRSKGGLFAWGSVSRFSTVILVEGLFDLAALWQAGFRNTTCAIGTQRGSRR